MDACFFQPAGEIRKRKLSLVKKSQLKGDFSGKKWIIMNRITKILFWVGVLMFAMDVGATLFLMFLIGTNAWMVNMESNPWIAGVILNFGVLAVIPFCAHMVLLGAIVLMICSIISNTMGFINWLDWFEYGTTVSFSAIMGALIALFTAFFLRNKV